jgi:hypothetical protein
MTVQHARRRGVVGGLGGSRGDVLDVLSDVPVAAHQDVRLQRGGQPVSRGPDRHAGVLRARNTRDRMW